MSTSVKDAPRESSSQVLKLLTNPAEIYDEAVRLSESSKFEVLIAAISENEIIHNPEFIDFFRRRSLPESRTSDFRIRVVVPLENAENRKSLSNLMKGLEYRIVDPTCIAFAVYDRRTAMLVRYEDEEVDSEPFPERKIVSAFLTNDEYIIRNQISMFDLLWRQSEIFEHEGEAKSIEDKASNEMRNLWNHVFYEIINYNQVMLTCTELLGEVMKESKGSKNSDLALEIMRKANSRFLAVLENARILRHKMDLEPKLKHLKEP
jgi:hypothetical protein